MTFDLNTKPEINDYALIYDADEPLGEKLIVKKLVSRKVAGTDKLFLFSSDRLPLIPLTAKHELRGVLSYQLCSSGSSTSRFGAVEAGEP